MPEQRSIPVQKITKVEYRDGIISYIPQTFYQVSKDLQWNTGINQYQSCLNPSEAIRK